MDDFIVRSRRALALDTGELVTFCCRDGDEANRMVEAVQALGVPTVNLRCSWQAPVEDERRSVKHRWLWRLFRRDRLANYVWGDGRPD